MMIFVTRVVGCFYVGTGLWILKCLGPAETGGVSMMKNQRSLLKLVAKQSVVDLLCDEVCGGSWMPLGELLLQIDSVNRHMMRAGLKFLEPIDTAVGLRPESKQFCSSLRGAVCTTPLRGSMQSPGRPPQLNASGNHWQSDGVDPKFPFWDGSQASQGLERYKNRIEMHILTIDGW